jgi:hypothetical protein
MHASRIDANLSRAFEICEPSLSLVFLHLRQSSLWFFAIPNLKKQRQQFLQLQAILSN